MADNLKGRLIQIRQGTRSQLNTVTLKVGELGFCTDTYDFFVGSATGNKEIAMMSDLASLTVNDGTISFAKLDTALQNRINEFIRLSDIPIATTTVDGLMSKTMYSKLASVANGATVNVVLDNLTSTSTTSGLSANQGRVLKNLIDNIPSSGGGTITVPDGSTSVKGIVQLSTSVSSTSTSLASTPSAVKQAYDLASVKYEKPSTGIPMADLSATVQNAIGSGGGSIANIYQSGVTTSSTGTAFGSGTTASGWYAYTEGYYTTASGSSSHAEGENTRATEHLSHAEGYYTIASGRASHAQGDDTEAKNYASCAMGRYSNMTFAHKENVVTTADAFVIGNGTSSTRSNAFRVTFDGKVFGRSAYSSSGADFAELFQWVDDNPNNEERFGRIVTLDGNKIRYANKNDEYILGIVSANPTVIGNSYEDTWQGREVKDEWERVQYHYVDVEYEDFKEVNGEMVSVTKTRQDYVPIINSDYDSSTPYTPREQRQEWDAVGLMGQLLTLDDGTCMVNGYGKVSDVDGILTHSDSPTQFRIMERTNDNIVRVFIK